MATFTFNIEAGVNLPPVVSVMDDLTVVRTGNTGIDVPLTAQANDPEGLAMTFLWEILTPLTASINNPASLTIAEANVLSRGVHTIRLTATDSAGQSASDEVNITVAIEPQVNRTAFGFPGNSVVGQSNPVFNITLAEANDNGQDLQQIGGGTSGAQVSGTKFLRVISTSSPDPNMTFSFGQSAGSVSSPGVLEFDPPINYGQGNLLITSAATTGDYQFRFEVETEFGGTDEQNFTIRIN